MRVVEIGEQTPRTISLRKGYGAFIWWFQPETPDLSVRGGELFAGELGHLAGKQLPVLDYQPADVPPEVAISALAILRVFERDTDSLVSKMEAKYWRGFVHASLYANRYLDPLIGPILGFEPTQGRLYRGAPD